MKLKLRHLFLISESKLVIHSSQCLSVSSPDTTSLKKAIIQIKSLSKKKHMSPNELAEDPNICSTILKGKTCALLNSVQKFIEKQGWLLLTFFICLHNQLTLRPRASFLNFRKKTANFVVLVSSASSKLLH